MFDMDATNSPESIVTMGAAAISAVVRRREISPVEILNAHLDRIHDIEPSLHALQEVLEDSASEEAAALAGRNDLATLPLAGVPVAIKDNVDVAGCPTRHGSGATSTAPAAADDELVRRLRAAGCVVIGKTQMPELAIWPLTEPEAFEPVRNPWDLSRSSGGSSGGSAVAVTTGMAALGLGTDGGGSIRVPAAACGIFGLKPAPGVVPLYGGLAQHWYGCSAVGPLARTVGDAALMLDVLAGTETYRAPKLPEAGLRIAVSTKHPVAGAHVSADVKAAIASVADSLAAAGHAIERTDPPYPPSPQQFLRCWLGGIAEDARATDETALEKRSRSMVKVGRWLGRRGLLKPATEMPIQAKMRDWFAGRDLLVTPVMATPPPRIGKWSGKGWISTTMGIANWAGYSPQWNVAGFAAASVPVGSAAGMPLAVMLVAPPGGEILLLSVAAQLEHIIPWPHWTALPSQSAKRLI